MEPLSQRGAGKDARRPIESGIGSPRGVLRIPVHFPLMLTFSMCCIFCFSLDWPYRIISRIVYCDIYLPVCGLVFLWSCCFRDPQSFYYVLCSKGLIEYTVRCWSLAVYLISAFSNIMGLCWTISSFTGHSLCGGFGDRVRIRLMGC